MKTIQKQKLSIVNRKSSIVNCTLSILLLFAAILFAGCTENTPGDDPDNPVNVVMQDLALQGTVKDESGNPLSGVKVTTGTLDTTTGSDGTFAFAQAGTVDDRAVVKFEKDGYFTLTRSGDKADEMYDEVMLYPKGNSDISLQTTFDASKAKTLQVGGVKIELPASCFVDAKGSAYSGTVHADVLYLAPDNENTSSMMPGGDLKCIGSDKSKKMVLPVGMFNVVLTDNAGNPLKIKTKTDIPVSCPAPAGVDAADLPATLPRWTFDEATGVLKEDGQMTLQGNSYTGTISHFSWEELGEYYKTFSLWIYADACDKPAVGARLTGFIMFPYGTLKENFPPKVTDAKGVCSIELPYTEDLGRNIMAFYLISYKKQTQGGTVVCDGPDNSLHDHKFDEECREEVTIKVTACDEPAAGAGVSAVMLDDGDPNSPIVTQTTNSAGECFFSVPANHTIYVIINYNEKQKDYEWFSDNSGPIEISFAFDDDCEDELPESATIKSITSNGEKEILTFGSHFQWYRLESWGLGAGTDYDYHNIKTYDSSTRIYGEKHCDECEWMWSEDDDGDLDYMHRNCLLDSDAELLKQGYKRRPGKIIAGKMCSAWSMDIGNLYYKWKRIRMSEASHNGDEVYWEVTEIEASK